MAEKTDGALGGAASKNSQSAMERRQTAPLSINNGSFLFRLPCFADRRATLRQLSLLPIHAAGCSQLPMIPRKKSSDEPLPEQISNVRTVNLSYLRFRVVAQQQQESTARLCC
jgi:hypothetical protein